MSIPIGRLRGLHQAIAEWVLTPWVSTAIFVGNGIGAIAGVLYWYGGQLRATPWYLWPFVPDSPGSTFMVIPALALIRWRRPGWTLFNAYAGFGVMKYGLWTVAFWSLYWRNGGPFSLESVSMTVTHLIMTLEGLALWYYTKPTRLIALGLGAWFVLNDAIDYGPLQTRPGLPPGVSVTTMMWIALGLSIALALALLQGSLRRE